MVYGSNIFIIDKINTVNNLPERKIISLDVPKEPLYFYFEIEVYLKLY